MTQATAESAVTESPEPFRGGYRPSLALLVMVVAGLLAATGSVFSEVLDSGDARLLALMHVQLGLAVFFARGRRVGQTTLSRSQLRQLALEFAACWGATAAFVLLFCYLSQLGPFGFLALSFVAWAAAFGACSVAPARAVRVGLLVLWSTPPLLHYLALEYGGRSALHLAGLSPNWLLALYPGIDWPWQALWPLALGAAVCWGVSVGLTFRGGSR